MTYQTQRQSHYLKESWEAEDSARQATHSAHVAQQYHNLIAGQTQIIDAELATRDQKIDLLTRRLQRIESAVSDTRTTGVVWGVGSAIVASLVMSLLMVPNNAPQVNHRSSYQIGGDR